MKINIIALKDAQTERQSSKIALHIYVERQGRI